MRKLITVATLTFLFLIATDIFSLLRGPAPYPPEWQWPYFFVNTLHRIWWPAIMIGIILSVGRIMEIKPSPKWLALLVILSFVFQISVLFFSRAGITVLIHRIINPDLNGYFTTATNIKNVSRFINSYQYNVPSYNQHAASHPPGAILFFYLINKLSLLLSFLNPIINKLQPAHADVGLVWQTLKSNEKIGAVMAAFFIPLLSSMTILPLFLLGKIFYGAKTALRASLLYIFIPALTLFTPLSDVFFPFFSTWTLVIFFFGIKNKNLGYLFLAGLVFGLSLFFSISVLPLIFIIYSFELIKSGKIYTRNLLPFTAGLLLFYLFFYFVFNFNIISVSQVLLAGQKTRSYALWFFYNLLDFFIFIGIPITVLYFSMLVKRIKDPLFLSLTAMLIVLTLSGAVRAEVGRIWLPFMPILILVITHNLTNKLKWKTMSFLFVAFLLSIQLLVMQEFWVTLW